MKKICFILCFLSVCFLSNGQTITIDNTTFDVGPYGQGSSITVPITTTDCFNVGNVFNLYLSDNNGNFVGNGTLIGSFNGFFTTFVNGIIPASTPAGTGYRLRVVSTNPAAVVSNTTNAFEINASTGPTAKANPDDPDRILVSQIYFGWCSGIKNDSIVINNLSTSGATITTILKNEKTLSTSTPSLVGNQFSIPLDQNYYTLTVKAVLNGATSTTSYFIINSPNNMNLSSSGSQTGCLPNTSNFQILTTSASSSKGIGDNFPGTQYKVDWGDGTSSLYKHCQLIAGNGNIFHLYSNTSCTVNGGNFKVIATLQNPFYSATGTETQKNCEHPSFSTEVSIFQKPSSSFTFPQYACENQSVTFTNTSTPGQAQSGPSCVSSAKYSWFVDGSQVYSSTTPEATPPDLSRSFSTVGTHTIKLLVNNLSCAVSDTTRTICIEPIPAPDFTMNPGACVPTSFTPVNTTNSNPCRPMTFAWSILDSLGNNTVNASFYTISNASASQPLITITKLGKYQLQLAVTNSCSTVVKRQTITVGGTPTAILPAAQSYCGAKTIDFATDANHKPTYDSQFGTSPTYSWSVSGGTFSYGNGTSATSAFPQITFNNLATYTVSVTFSTNCGTATTVSQQITLGAAPDVTVPSDQTFCNGVPTGIFNFSSSLNGTNYSWVNNNPTIGLAANGNGSIASFIASNTTGVPVTATITVTPLNGCVGISKSFTITVNPGATIANAGTNQKLCNALSTTLSGNIPVVGTGSWSKVFGNTVVIDNPTIPTSTLSGLAPFDSVVLAWTIQNTSNTCGATSDTVFIINRPTITVANAGNDTIICDFITANNTINLFGNKDTTRSFEIGTWSIVSQPNGGNGIFSNSNSPFSKFSFSKAGSYILKWSISNDAGCTPSFKTVIIKVNDKPSKGLVVPAMPSICIGASTTLTLTGYSGSILKWQYNVNPISDNIWIDTILTSSSISFNNIQDTFALRAIVVSTDAFCQLSDTTTPVVINATPQPIGGVTGPDTTVCGANNNGIINLTGYFGTIIRWEKSTDNGTTWTPLVNTTNAHLYSTILQTTKFRAVIQNGNCSPVTSTITTITVAGATGNSNAGVDQFLCNQNSTQLNAAVPPNGITGTWLQVAGSPVTIANASLYNTSITGLTPNTYKLVWAISNGFCAATNDTVIVTNYPALVNAISAINTTICSGQSVSIIGQTPSGGNGIYSYQWQQSVDSINWINISGANLNNINYSPTFSVFVRRLVTSSTCSTPSNAAVVTVQAGVSNNSISGDTTICIGNSLATLIGLQPTGGNNIYTFQWENSVDGGITWLPIGTGISKDFTPANLTTTTKFRRVVTTSICFGLQASISNIVTITINQNAKALFTYSKDIDCATFNLASTITNNTNSANGAYLWYANGNLIGTGTSMPNYSITNAFDSVTIKLKVTSLFGCKNDSLEHKFYTIPIPIPAFTISDTVGCGPLLLTLSNKTPNASLFNFKWDFGNGVTSNLINPTGGIVLQPNPSRFDTVYNISLTAFTTCDTVTVSQKVRVKSKPQALFTPNKSVGCSPLPISFNNTSRGNNMTFVWNFGDGSAPITTSSTNTLQHTYSTGKQDTFNVTLIATNSCGSDTITYNIIVSPNTIKLDFAVNATDVTTCLPSTVRFINNTIGATSFNWDFGDGNVLTTTKNIDTVTHVYTKAGTFITKLTASNGCSDTTDYEQIKAYAKPIVKFTASPLTACLGDSVSFVNQTDTATGYTWHYGNGATSSLTSPTYVYGGAGTYNAMLIAVRQYPAITCTDSTFTTINIVAKLNGSFTMSDSVSTCVPFKVVFTNLSVPSVLTTWDYGDGVKDTGDLVQHTYTNSGTFTAKMTAVNAGGCTYETTKNIVVKGPTGTWIYDKGLICVNKSVQFQVNVLNTDSLHFNFGDGTSLTTTSPIVNHTYTQSGNYLPSVQLLSGACYVTLKGVDTIKIEKITAGFTTVQQKNCGSTTVGFTDTTRSFYGVQTWQWNYGDGTPVGQTQNTQHTYTVGNTYGVQLIVVGNSGCSDTANLQLPITINSKPNATIQANVTSCVNQSVNYSATITSVDSVVLKLWKFATGASAIGNTASYTYSNAGTYTTAFITGTINGCFDTTYNTITVNPSPTLVASADVTICKGASTPLLATGSSNVTWLPTNNLSCTTCANPLAFPAVTTAYVASSTNGFGCTSTDTVVVTVFQPFTISVTPSDSICVGQSTKLGASGAFSYTWAPATGLSNAAIQNPVASPLVTTTYQVTGTDQYNCFTATASVVIGVGNYPVVNLGQDQVLAAGSTYTFTPSVTNGPIASWLWKPSTNLDCTTCPSVTATAKNDVCYVAQATNIYGCASTDAVCVKVFCESSQVFIPNAFMPGTGTGKNDILMVRSTGIKLVKSFRIYNRWGQVVFERANFVPNDRTYGWNGLVHGKPADTDVYIYTCEVVCENDTPFVYKGNVAVIR